MSLFGKLDQWVDVLLISGIQLNVIHVQEVANGHFTPESKSISTFSDDDDNEFGLC